MSVEILTVSLSDESIELVAQAVAAKLGLAPQQMRTGYVPDNAPAQPVPTQAPQGQYPPPTTQPDPWAAPGAPGATTAQATAAPVATPSTPAPGPSAAAPPASTPTCAHGAMRYVPGGFARSTGKAYAAFWGCPTAKGTPGQCKSIPA